MKRLPVSFFFFIICVTNCYAKNLTVTILYESLCPDSVRFLRDQFYPAYSTVLKDKINVELVPFGKANATKENNKWVFHCQHKEPECYGNKVQACAIDIAPKDHAIEFVVCAMKSGDASNTELLKECAKNNNITWKAIDDCLNSGKGDDLLAKNGNRTNALRPNVRFIPTILFNEAYRDIVQNLALKDFQDLSELLLEGGNVNSSSKISFSVLTIVISVLVGFKIF